MISLLKNPPGLVRRVSATFISAAILAEPMKPEFSPAS